MKTYNNLFDQLISRANISKAIDRASQRKKYRKDVRTVLDNKDKYILKIQSILRTRQYKIPQHKAELIYDGSSKKSRLIIKPRFLYEQIIQHALVQVLKPIFMKGMYPLSCGSIPKRGCLYGKRHMERLIRKYRNSGELRYVLKLDVKQYYQSVCPTTLRNKLFRVVTDPDVQYVIDLVLQSNIATYKNEQVCMGLPIGFYTSQWFANFYLQELDHYIKEQLGIKIYLRYVDDLVLFAKNKKELYNKYRQVALFLDTLKLTIKSNWRIFNFDYQGKDKVLGFPVDFMGYKFYRNRTTIRKGILLKATRKARVLQDSEIISWYEASQMLSYYGWFKRTNTYRYKVENIDSRININRLRSILSNKKKKENIRCI